MMQIRVTNVCFKSNTNCLINLKKIFSTEDGIKKKYVPNKFPGLILYFNHGTCLLFKSGYYSIAGCKEIDDGVKAQLELLDLLKKHNYEIKNVELKLTNLCGSFDCSRPINLIKLSQDYKRNAIYDIENFPAVKFTLDKYIFTIHHTGKVFVTGLKSIQDLDSICKNMYNILSVYLK
jgi:TATA-box binding protein (TBP) (component of TFIID and TFIIIB)